jgi:hypothetical protein
VPKGAARRIKGWALGRQLRIFLLRHWPVLLALVAFAMAVHYRMRCPMFCFL